MRTDPHVPQSGPARATARANRAAPRERRSPRERWDAARRFLELSATLAQSTIKLRFAGSRLGVLWSVLRPLLLFGVLYAVFTQVVRFGGRIPHYEVYLLTSIGLNITKSTRLYPVATVRPDLYQAVAVLLTRRPWPQPTSAMRAGTSDESRA